MVQMCLKLPVNVWFSTDLTAHLGEVCSDKLLYESISDTQTALALSQSNGAKKRPTRVIQSRRGSK